MNDPIMLDEIGKVLRRGDAQELEFLSGFFHVQDAEAGLMRMLNHGYKHLRYLRSRPGLMDNWPPRDFELEVLPQVAACRIFTILGSRLLDNIIISQ